MHLKRRARRQARGQIFRARFRRPPLRVGSRRRPGFVGTYLQWKLGFCDYLRGENDHYRPPLPNVDDAPVISNRRVPAVFLRPISAGKMSRRWVVSFRRAFDFDRFFL